MRDSTGTTTFAPVVLAVRPDGELRWIGKVGPGGIFDGEHTFLIQPLGRGRTRFTQREQFTGVAIPFYEHRLRADTLPQFRAMNAALARRASRTGSASKGPEGAVVLGGEAGLDLRPRWHQRQHLLARAVELRPA